MPTFGSFTIMKLEDVNYFDMVEKSLEIQVQTQFLIFFYVNFFLTLGGTENKFAFFHECYSQCEHYMVQPEDHIRNPICLQTMESSSEVGCAKKIAQEGFAFNNEEDEECVKHKTCAPTKNFFKTMNQCRKTCHYGLAEEMISKGPRRINKMNKKKAFRYFK